jgi:hypothetical protein
MSAVVLLPALTGRSACAQTSGRNPAAAQALYDEARRLVSDGRYADACPKFKESYGLDPGAGTLLNLADCYDKEGKTSLAWSTFKEALVAAQRDGRSDRVEYANQHIAALEHRLTRLTVNVSATAHAPGLVVTVDGTPLGDAAWGVALPVDPGKHVVRAEAEGKKPFETSVDVSLGSGAPTSVDIAPLEDAPSAAGGPAGARTPAGTTPADTTPIMTTGGSDPRATVGWILEGVGVVSLALGSYFGITAFSKWSDRKNDCAGGCNQAAATAGSDASTAATISDVGFGVGIAAIAVGTYLVLSGHAAKAPASSTSRTLRLAPVALDRGAGLWVEGGW